MITGPFSPAVRIACGGVKREVLFRVSGGVFAPMQIKPLFFRSEFSRLVVAAGDDGVRVRRGPGGGDAPGHGPGAESITADVGQGPAASKTELRSWSPPDDAEALPASGPAICRDLTARRGLDLIPQAGLVASDQTAIVLKRTGHAAPGDQAYALERLTPSRVIAVSAASTAGLS